MKWIAITGGIACGKTKVGEILRQRGYAVVDADDLAREVVQPGQPGYHEVIQTFGPGVVLPNGELDRQKLGAQVFADSVALRALEDILHPRIQHLAQERRQQLASAGHAQAFYLVPLVYEKNLQTHFTQVVVVYCAEALQRQRLQQRNQMSAQEVEQRLRAQLPVEEKRARADYVIDNNGSLSDLEISVAQFLSHILSQSRG